MTPKGLVSNDPIKATEFLNHQLIGSVIHNTKGECE